MTDLIAWWQIALALSAAALVAGPLCSWLEARADRRDAQVWANVPGAVR